MNSSFKTLIYLVLLGKIYFTYLSSFQSTNSLPVSFCYRFPILAKDSILATHAYKRSSNQLSYRIAFIEVYDHRNVIQTFKTEHNMSMLHNRKYVPNISLERR